jgi:hypothetical protein
MELEGSPDSLFTLTEDSSCIPLLSNENQLIAKSSESYYNLHMHMGKHFDIPFIAVLALREKQIQQNYRMIIAVYKPGRSCCPLMYPDDNGHSHLVNYQEGG